MAIDQGTCPFRTGSLIIVSDSAKIQRFEEVASRNCWKRITYIYDIFSMYSCTIQLISFAKFSNLHVTS